MFFTREKNNTSNQNRERCLIKCEKNDTSDQKSQRCVSFAPKFPPLIGACSLQLQCFADIIEKSFSRQLFLVKSEKHLRHWSGIVLCILLSMKRIVESRLNNSGRGKTERDVSKLCFLSELLSLPFKLYLSLYSNRPFYLNSFIFNCSFRTKVNITCKFLDYLISLPSLILLTNKLMLRFVSHFAVCSSKF